MKRKETYEKATSPAAMPARLLFFLLLYLLYSFPGTVLAQIGTWHHYPAYHEIQEVCEAEKQLFVLASNGLYLYNPNDQSIQTYDKTNGLSDTHIAHIAWSRQARRLIAVYENANIDLIETDGDVVNISALYSQSMTEDKTVIDVRIDGIYAYLVTGFAIIKVNLQKAEIAETYTLNHPEYPSSLPEKDLTAKEKYLSILETLNPSGPFYNHFYESRFVHDRLYTTGGYFLPGIPDPGHRGIIQTFDGENWTCYEEEINTKTGYDYKDICCIDVDPNDQSHVFAGGRCGLYEFRDGKLIHYYNRDNSPLKGALDRGIELGNSHVLVLAIKFDSKGNLWVLNSQAKETSLLELTPDGKWTDHHQNLFADEHGVSLAAFRSMFFDSRGLLWFVNDSWFNPSVLCYDINHDKAFRYHIFTNQDGTTYNVKWVYCATEDREGNIWVGTDLGPFMISKDEVGQEQVIFNQVKVPRNDGTHYADYLLNGIGISSIAVDEGNRKWFGTNGSGTFLISADNIEQIENFRTDNSKLISNTISSISINPRTGRVYFLTDKGLCAYQGDATQPADEMTEGSVYAYPNPVTPDYTGLITVTGLTYDADVKILAANGALIAEGRSNGGTFTWDGKDRKGRSVASGIYMVVTATAYGKRGTVCKIAIVR